MARTQSRILDPAMRGDPRTTIDPGPPVYFSGARNLDAGCDLDIGPDDNAGRVAQDDSGSEMAIHDICPQGLLKPDKFLWGIDAPQQFAVAERHADNGQSLLSAETDHLGQVELSLGVVLVHLGQELRTSGHVEHVHTRIYLSNLSSVLHEIEVLLFDNPDDSAFLGTDDPTIAKGVFQFQGKHAHGGTFFD